MEIQVFKEASKIPEKFLPSLVDAEIECWWSEPFKEFIKCSNPKCWRLYSIQDVYWDLKTYRERKKEKIHTCNCWSQCEEVYPKKDFLWIFKDYFKWKVSVVLLLNDNEEVRGFWIVSANKLWNIIDLELATRPNSYDRWELLRELSKTIFGIDDASWEEVTIWHHIFVGEEFRWTWYWKFILDEILKLSKDYWLNIVVECKFDANSYPITRSLWAKNIINDKYGYVVQFLEYQNLMWEIWEKISSLFWFYKKEAMKILKQNPHFFWNINY